MGLFTTIRIAIISRRIEKLEKERKEAITDYLAAERLFIAATEEPKSRNIANNTGYNYDIWRFESHSTDDIEAMASDQTERLLVRLRAAAEREKDINARILVLKLQLAVFKRNMG